MQVGYGDVFGDVEVRIPKFYLHGTEQGAPCVCRAGEKSSVPCESEGAPPREFQWPCTPAPQPHRGLGGSSPTSPHATRSANQG